MRRNRLLVLLVTVTISITAGCGDGDTVNSAQVTTSSTLPATTVFTVPPPPPEPAPPFPLPPVLPGSEGIVNVHSPVLSFRPGQTEWTATSSGVTVALRMDTPAPKVGQPVTFDVAVSTATLACCAVIFRPGGGDVTYGGQGCLPPDRAGSRSATFRWVHVYEGSGRFEIRLTAIAGLCGGPLAGAGVSGTVEVT